MNATNPSLRPPESSAPIVLWVLPLVGSVFIPGLWWTLADWPFALRPDLIATMTVVVAITATSLLSAISLGFRRRIRWSLGVTTAVVLGGFQWRTFTIAGETVADSTGIPLAAEVLPVALGGALLWMAVRLAGDVQFAAIVGFGMAIAVTVLTFNAYSLTAPAPPAFVAEPAEENAPHVLVLVLDGYGRADWLTAEFDFDNTPFLEDLEQRGFTIAHQATSNYSYTYSSVSTMLNLDYVFAAGQIDDQQRKQMRAATTGATGVIPAFKQAGYEVAYVENAFSGSQCGSAVDWCIRDGLLGRSLWNLGQMTILAPVFRMVTGNPVHSLSVDHLEALGDWLAKPTDGGQPRFTFAHVLSPHYPLLLNADCSVDNASELSRWGPEQGELLAARRANYTEQVACTNRRTLEAVDALLAVHPDSIIMITGDHGPGSTLDPHLSFDDFDDSTVQERMKILSAYRVPGCPGQIRDDITPVNGARAIMNCATGTDLDPLPDLNYWSDPNAEGLVTEITSMVHHD